MCSIVKNYNFSYEYIFYIITTVFYYIVIHHLFIHQPLHVGAHTNTLDFN